LTILACSAVLCLALPVTYLVVRAQVPGGLAWGFGNRERPLAVPAWAGRAQRAHANLVENLAPFAALVLAAHASGRANAATALAAVYIAGIPYLRTAVFFVATAGELVILAQLLG